MNSLKFESVVMAQGAITSKPNPLTQDFDAWIQASLEANEYAPAYRSAANGNEKLARLLAANGETDSSDPAALLAQARSNYWRKLMDAPREASMSLNVWDSLPVAQQVDAQRHFYDLDSRLTRRDQDAAGERVLAEKIKRAPYEAALAEVDAEIKRLDKISGAETEKQKDLSMRRERLREAMYQIGQGKEPDGRLIRTTPASTRQSVEVISAAGTVTNTAVFRHLVLTNTK